MAGTGLSTRTQSSALAQQLNEIPKSSIVHRLWSMDQLRAIVDMLIPEDGLQHLRPDHLELFAHVCERGGFDPFLRQIYLIPTRQGPKIHIGIDGLRLIAQRASAIDATDGPYWCDKQGQWTDLWISEKPPVDARYGIRRRGSSGYQYAVALWSEFKGNGPNWEKKPAHMLALVAERHALRKTCQHELASARQQYSVPGAVLTAGDEDEPDHLPSSAPAVIDAPRVRAQHQERKGPPLDREFSHAVEAGEIPDFGPDDASAAEEEEPASDMHQQYAELVRRARAAGLRNVPMMALDAPDDFVQAKYDEWLPKVETAERAK